MLMTEKDAATKWCPHRHESNEKARPVAINATGVCIGSSCSQWRWFDRSTIAQDKRQGYCGLAGAIFAR